MRIVVFKFGGSLFDLAGLGGQIERWIARRPDVAPLIVVGGGVTADRVRSWDQTHGLGEERAHWLAVRAMGLNEALLRELLPRCVRVSSRQDVITQASRDRIPLLDTMRFLEADERQADALPHCWDVTSDSIAARAAVRFEADELVLGKSVSLDEEISLAAAQAAGLVDAYFHRPAGRIPQVGWTNLREAHDFSKPVIVPWLSFGEPRCDRARLSPTKPGAEGQKGKRS